jgi:hypothetical protein
MIILQEVVYLPGSFNLISQSQMMHNDVKVEKVNHNSLNLCNRHRNMIATSPQVDGRFVLDRAPESTQYTDIDNHYLLALKMTRHASRHNAEKRMLSHCRLAHVGLKALEILPTMTYSPNMTGK